MTEETPDPGLPVSDGERAHVVSLLERAVAQGRLDAAAFDDRSQRAIAAGTRGELNALVLDLPLEHPDRARAAARTADDTVRLSATLSSVKRRGPWAVPRRLVIEGWLTSAELDLTEAAITHDVLDVELDVVAGSVELRLPDGASVEFGDLTTTVGSTEDHRRDGVARGHPHVVLSGRVVLGSVEIRGPSWLSRRRRSRDEPR